MKQAIITALNGKFAGVSANILGRVADKLINSGKVKKAEDIADAVADVTFQQVLEQYGDSRADEAQKSAVKNYEDKYKIKDGKPVEETNGGAQQPGATITTTTTAGQTTTATQQPSEQSEQPPAWAQALLEQNKALNARLDAMQQEKTATTRQSKLAEVLKNAPETVRSRYEKDFARMTFKDDAEFEGWITELTPDIEQMSTDLAAKGGVVGRPKGGAQGGAQPQDNPYLKARLEERAAAAPSTPAIQGLTPTTNP
ncbi:MAG: hypothetical protein NC131_12740 [Roseburia sp.]|nr:hypothetical protein [Roseburia sp.]